MNILIHRPGLLGTLVHIRRGLQLKTHEYLRTHWDSSIWHPRGSEAGPYILPYCTFSNFDLCHLLALPFFAPWFFSPSLLLFFSLNLQILFLSHICLLSLVSVVPQSSGATEADEGMSTCLSPSPSALPSQRAASVRRRLRCGRWCGSWFFFCSNHSQRTDHGLIWVFTARPYFSHQWCECLLKPSPLHFWSNLHHMPLKGDEPTGRRASL